MLSSGTSTAPGLAFSTETNSGLYRAGAGDVRMQVGATQTQKWAASGVTFPVAVTSQTSLTATTATTNGNALACTGNGTGSGLAATGGATSGVGLTATGGAPNGRGITATGTGTGDGVWGVGSHGVVGTGTTYEGVYGNGFGTYPGGNFFGGSTSGAGVTGYGGAPNGGGGILQGTGTGDGLVVTGFHGVYATGTSYEGVQGIGASGQAGGLFQPGTAATASTRQTAINSWNGDVTFGNVTNPASNAAVANSLTPKNIIKLWANISTNGAGGVTLNDGYNVNGISLCGTNSDDVCVAPVAGAYFANTAYACTVTVQDDGLFGTVNTLNTSLFHVRLWTGGGGTQSALHAFARTFFVMCVGAQ